MQLTERKKINRIFFIFVCLFTAVIGKAFKVQVLDRDKLISRSKKQFFRERKIYPNRGNIYDRNGHPLALNIQTYSLFTIPKNIKNKKQTYKELEKLVPELTTSVIAKKVKNRKRFTWLARKVELSINQIEKIKKIKGIYVEAVPKRLYPNHELLAQSLGFVGVDNAGLSGLEYNFDKILRGEPKILKYIIDNKGRPVSYESGKTGVVAQDIHLTIDKDLQAIAEKAIKDQVEEFNAVRGGIGVIDTSNGEILAIANYPTFDPNEVRKSKPENRKLSFISDPFEPGSTFKSFTVASALEHKIARPDTNYFCELGRLKVGDHIISEADSNKKHEWLSMEEILKYSSNIGTTKIAFDLTYPKLKTTIDLFGIGKKTGIEIPGESRGIFTSEKNVTPLSLSNISFGQGVATTGIQMLAAYAAIVNDGIYIPPTMIKDSKRERLPKRIISKKTADEITKMLIGAVEDGTGKIAKVPYFSIAGKTSTAQKSDKSGKYSGYIPGFIGYPVNVDKKFAVYVYIDTPAKGKAYYGGTVAGPVFKKVAQHLLYKNKEFDKLAVQKVDIKKRSRAFDSIRVKRSATRSRGKGLVPNFVGLDKISANILAKKLGFEVMHRGIGVVNDQNPKPGNKYNKKTVVRLIFAPPSYE